MYASNQEVFNTVADHLMRQGRRAAEEVSTPAGIKVRCRYRAEDGSRCAIGCLIPDALYSESMESRGVSSLVHDGWYGPAPLDELFSAEVKGSKILVYLQDIHDSASPDIWAKALMGVASHFKLQLPPILAATAADEAKPVPVVA